MDSTFDSPGCTVLPAQLNVSSVCFVLKAREVLLARLLTVAQETVFDIAKGPSLPHFSSFNTICSRTL